MIAKVAGIPIRLHFTFLLFLLWVGLNSRGSEVWHLGLVLALFGSVVLHELGHSLVARRYGLPVTDITLYPIGGVARIEKRPTAKQELWIALAGPAVNFALAALLLGVLSAHGGPASPGVSRLGSGGWTGFLTAAWAMNLTLGLFNLIPAFPMDGGRVLRAILALYTTPQRATRIAADIGQAIAICAGIAAFLSHPPQWMLLFIALFVYIGAGQEAFAYRQEAILAGVRVQEAMVTDVRTLRIGDTLREAADVLLSTSQHDFPVLHGDAVQGLLTRNGLLRGLAEQGPTAYVAGAMDRAFLQAAPGEDLGEFLPRLQAANGPALVLEEERLLGLLTVENIAEFFAVRQIVAGRRGA